MHLLISDCVRVCDDFLGSFRGRTVQFLIVCIQLCNRGVSLAHWKCIKLVRIFGWLVGPTSSLQCCGIYCSLEFPPTGLYSYDQEL